MGKAGIDITSPGVWVEGVEGAELGDGPVVFAVPVLLAGPDEDPGCFLFLPIWFFETLKCNQITMLGTYLLLVVWYRNQMLSNSGTEVYTHVILIENNFQNLIARHCHLLYIYSQRFQTN